MRKQKATKKWSDIRSELVRRLTSEVSKETSVTADSNVSQVKKSNAKQTKPLSQAERLHLPQNEAKRKAGFEAYWNKRRKRKEQMDKWRDKNGLTSVNFIVPDDLLQAFKAKAESESKSRTEVLRELMLEYITRPDKS
jgi:hypothetical protein